jgi:hypothetical protein
MRLLGQVSYGQDAYALASLNLAEHEYQRWGEIDFFVVTPEGMLAIEVKGGAVDCIDGIWRFEDRRGRVVKKSISPIAQAQGGYSSLMTNYIKPAFSGLADRVPSGFCALFPAAERSSVESIIGGPEMPAELVGTKEDCANPAALKAFLDRVFEYFRTRMKFRASTLRGDDARRVVALLRPSFDRVPPLASSMKQAREDQFALTEDQYRLLDFLETAPRILCTGGAGSGKTFIAVECLRRELANNPVFVTGTENLALHLRASEPRLAARIFTYQELVAKSQELRGAFSTLVVDEGQQVTQEEAITHFSSVLGKPLEVARWRWFADPHHQVSSTSRFDPVVQARLLSWAGVHPVLPDNCRNTPQIVRTVEFLTGLGIGKTRTKGQGPEVDYAHSTDPANLLRETADKIRQWIDKDEIPPGDIALLTMAPLAHSSIPAIAAAAGLGYAKWKPGWNTQIRYPSLLAACTIEEFRGLEAPFVVLCDLGGDFAELERAFYLGLTRANFGIFISCEAGTKEAFVTQRLLGGRAKSTSNQGFKA